jgi:hypothetical protein
MGALARLACRVAGHRAVGAVWNHGYGFARCRRCERAVMRPVFGRWRLPPAGWRIVWPEPAARSPAPPPRPDRRPTDDWDVMEDAAPAPRGRAMPAADPFAFDDFMADAAPPASARVRRRP